MIGVVIPTRGLVFARVESAIEGFREKYQIRVYRSDNLPIPQGHSLLSQQALADGVTHVWFVEEDTVPPPNALDLLLKADADIACIDYGVNGWSCITRTPEDEILWCGLGCTLIKKEVFETLEQPWFRIDKVLRLNDWTWMDLSEEYVKNKSYGSLDIWFFTQARKKGFTIIQAEGECEHLQLVALGQKEVNFGLHEIKPKLKIEKRNILTEGGDNNI